MNTKRKRILLSQHNMVELVQEPIFSTGLRLDKALLMLKQGHRACDIMRKYNILEIDKVELFKAEEELLKIDPTVSVLSTIDNKSHEVRFITKINEFKHQLDPIADEIRSLFKSNSNLKKFSLPQRN
jgi:hypothetical protein